MLTDTEKSQLDEHGFLLLEHAIIADGADELRDLSMSLAAQEREAGRGYMYIDDKAQRVWNLVDKGELFETPVQFFPLSPDKANRTTVADGLGCLVEIVKSRFSG